MSPELRIAAVSYSNTKPFLYGLEQHGLPFTYDLLIDIPSRCWSNLEESKADIGLVPVAKLNSVDEYYLHTDYCIGCKGAVDSVFLFSQVPLAEITEILMDYHSETSVRLTKVLAKHHWKINPNWSNTKKGFEDTVQGTTAAVIIGDRTFGIKDKFKYAYDLGAEWQKFSGMPFVFACWVSLKEVPESKIVAFNKALNYGLIHLDEMLEKESNPLLSSYLKNSIDYSFDSKKKEALKRFLELSKEFT
ncbi:MAG: menaquinone biosynthesis protein [Flavobacteriales bacterium]|nr:menaquinone biosynthesis protein [Flavobacteriales bacterium]